MTYPPQGNPYPPQGNPYPMQGVPQPMQPTQAQPLESSHKVMAIIAVVLAALTGLFALAAGAILGFNWLNDIIAENLVRRKDTVSGIAGLVGAFGGLLLLIGAGVMAKRRGAGRVVIIIGLVPVAGLIVAGPAGIAAAVGGLAAIALAFLARTWFLPKWSAHPQYTGYSQSYGQPGYGQPPQQWR